jgi:hypothetical protein
MIPLMIGAYNSLHPGKGDGWPETVVLFMLIGTLIYCQVSGMEVNPYIAGTSGVVVGYFFGKEAPKEAREEDE